MIEISLTRGKVALVSDEDADLADVNWCAHSDRAGPRYAKRVGPRPVRKMIYMHRVIAERMGFDLAGCVVDHMNGNGFDNRRENIRAVSHSENLTNVSGAMRNSKSGILGVSFTGHRWAAVIQKDRQSYRLGHFVCIGQAAKARKNAERELFGVQPQRTRA